MKPSVKKALPCIALLLPLISLPAVAQNDCNRPERHDIGVTGGATFYMGDLGDNYSFFRDLSYYAGLLYRFNINEFYALRGQVSYGKLAGDVHRPDLPPSYRGHSRAFHRTLFLAEAAGEVGFLPLNVIDFFEYHRVSPYLLGGGGVAALTADKTLSVILPDHEVASTGYLLLGVGIKWAVFKRITVGAEWIMRKTFTDKIDYCLSPPGSPLINNDWIGSFGLTITYRLSEDFLCPAYRQREPSALPLKGIRQP